MMPDPGAAQMDADLLGKVQRGDELAMAALYDRYSKIVYSVALRVLRDPASAEDVLQESFIEAFRNLQNFEHRTSFGGWLKQICVNRSINQLKKSKLVFVDIEKTGNR